MFTAKHLTALGCIALLSLPVATPAAAAHAPKSEIDKAIGRCVATVAIGALLGAAIGNNSGRGNAGRGAVLGAAAGGVVCAVLLKVAKDKTALLEHQREAVAMGGTQQVTFEGHDGPVTLVSHTRDTDPRSDATGATQLCRLVDSEVQLSDNQQASLGSQLYCRNDAGDWAIADAKTLGRS